MSGRDEALRRLLRDADPARDAAELPAVDVARLRRSVLRPTARETRRPLAPLAWAAALAAVVLALAIGLALSRTPPPPEASPNRLHASASPPGIAPPRRPANDHLSSTTATAPTLPRAGDASRPRLAASSGSARIHHRRSQPVSRARQQIASPPSTAMPAEEVVATQTAPEQPPYQLQLTAPGGTRIVWLLTNPSGR